MKSKIPLLLIFLVYVITIPFAYSWEQYGDAIKLCYKESKVKEKYGCKTCHIDTGNFLNPFGKDMDKILNTKKVSINSAKAAIKWIELFDSDGDGYINREEIIAGSNPGDKESLPDFPKDYGFFKLTSPLNYPRYLHSSVLLPDGKVLVTGGVTTGMKVLASAEIYDPATEQFTLIGEMNAPRCSHSLVLLNNGKVLIIGGRAGLKPDSKVLSSCEIYDPVEKKFSFVASLNEKRRNPVTTLLSDGRVLITGGGNGIETYDLSEGLNSCEIYDPKTDKIFLTGEMHYPRLYHEATLLSDGKVLITGGSKKGVLEILDSAEIYEPKSGKFILTGSMLKKRMTHSSVLLPDGKVLITGGTDPSSRETFAEAEIYDPLKGKFISISPMLLPRTEAEGVTLDDGKILFAGGSLLTSFFYRSSEVYDPQKGSFSFGVAMNVARDNVSPVKLLDGRVLYCGGVTPDFKFIRMAELFIPSSLSKAMGVKKQEFLKTKSLEPFIKVEKNKGNIPFKTRFMAYEKSGSDIISYIWDFGDNDEALGKEVEHTFYCPETYQVSLSLISKDGKIGKAATSVEALGDKKDISFSCQVKPILDNRCIGCHGSRGGLSLTSYDEVMRGGQSGKVVIPDKPDDSLLIQRVTIDPYQMMSPEYSIVSSEIDLIKAWIKQGAMNN